MDTRTLPLPPVTLLYALRYGLGRETHAHDEVIALARANWPALSEFRRSILRDCEYVLETATRLRRTSYVVDSTREFERWVRDQPHPVPSADGGHDGAQ